MVVGEILYSGSSDCTIRALDGKGIRWLLFSIKMIFL